MNDIYKINDALKNAKVNKEQQKNVLLIHFQQ